MTTLADPKTKTFANRWESAIASAVFSGIVGDAAHGTSGYHISIENCTPGDYSVVRVDDAAPPGSWPRNLASAVDMSLSSADMIKNYGWVHAVFANHGDPRRNYINAINTWRGSGDASRLDMVSSTETYASPDHKWHCHLEIRRRFVQDDNAYDAAFSIVTGESLDAYLARHGQQPPAPTTPPLSSGGLPSVPNGTRTLSNNGGPNFMSGTDVLFVQKFIGASKCGIADGYFGPQTAAGVEWYQRMRGIGVDGIVGPQTWSNLLGRTIHY